jgi:hypothetical protein
VIEIAKVDCSGLSEEESVGIRAGGTGMYDDIRDRREDRWTAYSGRGPLGVWMLTARPLKQGMLNERMDLLRVNDSGYWRPGS